MRIPIVAGNWKMSTNIPEALQLVKDMLPEIETIDGVEKVLCPPFISLAALKELIGNSTVKLGAQNMYYLEQGAYTGEISPRMLTGLCQYVILGHSERRAYFGETDELINKKVISALGTNLCAILCVGETLEEREKGLTEEVIARQLKKALSQVSATNHLVIAYEPVWAIGTGKAATGEEANKTITFIRSILASIFSKEIAQNLRIQYGGSVTPANIVEFIKHVEIDGALVGGASLKAGDFLSILKETAAIKSNL